MWREDKHKKLFLKCRIRVGCVLYIHLLSIAQIYQRKECACATGELLGKKEDEANTTVNKKNTKYMEIMRQHIENKKLYTVWV